MQPTPCRRGLIPHLAQYPPELVVRADRYTLWGNPHRSGWGWDEDQQKMVWKTKERAVQDYRKLMLSRVKGLPGPKLERAYRQRSSAGRGPTDEEQVREALKWINRLISLQGKIVVCWCEKPEPCHVDVLVELSHPTQIARMRAALKKRQTDADRRNQPKEKV